MKRILAILFLFLAACGTPTAEVTPQVVTVYAAGAAEAWLTDVYDCAAGLPGVVVARAADPGTADIALRLGEPPRLGTPAFSLGEAAIDVVLNLDNPLAALDEGQVADLFAGRIRDWRELGGADAAVQVWVYGAEDDLQRAFDGVVLEGGPVSSLARQAASPDAMRAAVAGDAAAIGFLPRRWVDESLRVVSLERPLVFPVLALTPDEPQGAVRRLLACLQP